MALFLAQHGKSLPKDVDPDQGLSREGISEVKRIADVAKGYGISVSRIEHSGKTRARKTAEIYAAALGPEEGVHERSGLKPLDDVAILSGTLKSGDGLMLVGHLPFMERLTSYLITGSADTPVFKFQNGGIVCLDRDPETKSWMIIWALMPRIA
ncbi:MAG: phosphohistidine phosphatase SixA [Pseudomonadota bacterium]